MFFCSSGYVLHYKDMPLYFNWLKYINPMSWLLPYLINRELSPDAIASSSATTLCRNKQVKKLLIVGYFDYHINYLLIIL